MSLKNRLIPSLSIMVLLFNGLPRAGAETASCVSSAAIEATASVVDPVGLTEATGEVLPVFFEQSGAVYPTCLVANTGEQYGLFYCPRGGKALLQIEADGSLVRQVHMKARDDGSSELLITNASIPNVSLVSMEALVRSLPPGVWSCQVTIIYSEN
jgi:hypothetical protein